MNSVDNNSQSSISITCTRITHRISMDLKILIKIMNLKKIVDEVLLIFQLLSKQKRVFQIFIFISYRQTREQKMQMKG